MAKYVDENGEPIDPEDLDGYEAVDLAASQAKPPSDERAVEEGPAAREGRPAAGRRRWPVIAGAAFVVAVTAGAVVLTRMEPPTPKPSISERVEAKSSEVRQSVAPSSSTAASSSAPEPVAGVGCGESEILAAVWKDGAAAPGTQLRVVEAIDMPVGFATREDEAGQRAQRVILQLSDERLGVYIASTESAQSNGKALWWKVPVAISGGFSVLGEAYGDGNDKDALRACKTIDEGAYRVVGEGGSDDHPTAVSLIKPIRAFGGELTSYALIGDKLAKIQIERTPAESSGGDDETGEGGSSSSAVPSK
ncbi:hypothetical protein GII30_02550 [Gordonia amarae]|uniref:Uncharacterized protein n=2 Tax=Gordonia amarae TaxID=36821 RepID=G7GN38_9ACTN|nr:hypothetical protein [Gordonia amarae]MCS3877237.1 hypothetical protein [Gordonia amarae]QHN16011.1 hypothetical protein GII35_02545 [Gordonia amarae]QHN20580.1 hypothetical protein GII34_02545 [Gordonia amarae]QHN29431.1 hypothetical protein GII32_02550 [Gordonia amarae]QHN38207.1 hypothetical protein GII30_02550 [Gordonia amarae]